MPTNDTSKKNRILIGVAVLLFAVAGFFLFFWGRERLPPQDPALKATMERLNAEASNDLNAPAPAEPKADVPRGSGRKAQ